MLRKIYNYLLSLTFFPNWVIDSSVESVLDVGCGQGLPMELIRMRFLIKRAVGIDIYKPYIKECQQKALHDEYIISDVRNIDFKDGSFDLVMSYQVIEHLEKRDAFKLVEKMEKIASKLVIISTPFGESDYHTDDGNVYQEHKSYFYPEEFTRRGYKIFRIGGKSLYGPSGIFWRTPTFLQKILYLSDILLMPYYFLFQSRASYYFFAYKNKHQ